VPLAKPGAVLLAEARDAVRTLGYPDPPTDSAWGFRTDWDYVDFVARTDSTRSRWDRLATKPPSAVRFWYRGSPQSLVARDVERRVSYSDPPPLVSGMTGVQIDSNGRLYEFFAVPPQIDSVRASAGAVEWNRVFALAGLDIARFQLTDTMWTPPYHSDTTLAWSGAYSEDPSVRVRVEAAAFRGSPTYFRIVGPWDRPDRMTSTAPPAGVRVVQVASAIVVLSLLVAGMVIARRNLRLGRGDRRGAFRLAAYVLVVAIASWMLLASHAANFAEEFTGFVIGLGQALFVSAFLWLMYMALEPYVRRRWPYRIVSWTRAVSGRFRDPLVGRDLLVGGVFGIAVSISFRLTVLLPAWLGQPPPSPIGIVPGPLLGLRGALAAILSSQVSALINALALLFVPLLLVVLLRRERLANGVFFLVMLLLVAPAWGDFPTGTILAAVAAGLYVLVVLRFGLVATAMAFFTTQALLGAPLTLDASAWYAGSAMLAALSIAGLAVYAFVVSLGGRPAFGGGLLRD
jgi:serine/threonine-protein kinase